MPFCENCGNEIGQLGVMCPRCGHQTGSPSGAAPGIPQAPVAYGPRRTEGTAVASLVLGIGGFLVCPLVLHVLAIIFGRQAQQKIAADPSLDGEGMAKAGVVLGWIGVGVTILVVIIVVLVAALGRTNIEFRRF